MNAETIGTLIAAETPFILLLIWFHRQAISRLDQSREDQGRNHRCLEKILIRHDEQIKHNKEDTQRAHDKISSLREEMNRFHPKRND